LTSAPQSGAAALLLLRAQLLQGKSEDAQKTIGSFPATKETTEAEKLRPLLEFIAEAKTIRETPRDSFAAGYFQCGLLAARGSFPPALDGMLDLLRQDKHYRKDEARKVYLAILEAMGETDPLTRDYRDRLASVLF
jgi:putative thioredoxin